MDASLVIYFLSLARDGYIMIKIRYLIPEVVLLFESPLVETGVGSLAVALYLSAIVNHVIKIVVQVVLILSLEGLARGTFAKVITFIGILTWSETFF